MNRIIQFFPNADLRCNHQGLTQLAKKSRVNPGKLKKGEYAVFMNRLRTQLKILTWQNLLINYKHTAGEFIDLQTIKEIPNYLDKGRFQYNKAVANRFRRLHLTS